MAELAWGWYLICSVLFDRLCPKGIMVPWADMDRLPMEHPMAEERDPRGQFIRFRFVTIGKANSLTEHDDLTGDPAGVSEMQGVWQALACVLLWKLAKDGITITPSDRARLPHDRILLGRPLGDALELLYVPRQEAERIRQWEKFNVGKSILERA